MYQNNKNMKNTGKHLGNAENNFFIVIKIAQKWCIFILSQKYSIMVLLDKMIRALKYVFYVFNLVLSMCCTGVYSKYFFLLIKSKKGMNLTYTSDMTDTINSQFRFVK